jgi:hypothetical protein
LANLGANLEVLLLNFIPGITGMKWTPWYLLPSRLLSSYVLHLSILTMQLCHGDSRLRALGIYAKKVVDHCIWGSFTLSASASFLEVPILSSPVKPDVVTGLFLQDLECPRFPHFTPIAADYDVYFLWHPQWVWIYNIPHAIMIRLSFGLMLCTSDRCLRVSILLRWDLVADRKLLCVAIRMETLCCKICQMLI